MAAPPDAKPARWNQAVSAVVQQTGMTPTEADEWLNVIWHNMFIGDERAGNEDAHDKLKKFFEAQHPIAPTLPWAFYDWAKV